MEHERPLEGLRGSQFVVEENANVNLDRWVFNIKFEEISHDLCLDLVVCFRLLQVVEVFLRSQDCDSPCSFGDDEVGEGNELGDQRSELRVACSNEDGPFTLLGLLGVVVYIAWVLVSVEIEAYL